jgi:DAACS family dicarboxylate/amino acid:cation (Na+ or H+) symporter
MTEAEAPKRGLSLHTKILLGLLLGAACGITANVLNPRPPRLDQLTALAVAPTAGMPGTLPWAGLASAAANQPLVRPPPRPLDYLTENVMRPIGQVFLNFLFMTVVPLVVASLAVGVARLGDLRSLGRVGAKTFAYFVGTMTVAVVIGLVLVNTIRPGAGMTAETRKIMEEKYGQQAKTTKEKSEETAFGVDTFVKIVPRNPLRAMLDMDMLAVIFFALLIGVGLTVIAPTRAEAVLLVLEGVSDLMVFIIGLAMRIAPIAVFALLFRVTADLGWDVLRQLGVYVAVVLIGLAIQMFGVLSILVWTLSRMSPLVFFRKVRAVIVTAFSTSSSNATLPTSIKVSEEELGVPPQIAGFVLPLGATMNMNGTALFEGVTVMFLAQVFGMNLDLGQQIIIVVMAVLTAIGAAGVPGGSLPLLVMVLAMFHIPEMGIALVLGVDRILDMCRTTLNVIGDIAAATFVARSEGYKLNEA